MKPSIESLNIDGVRIDNITMVESIQAIKNYCKEEKGKKIIATPNIDFLFNASKNPSFKKVLNKTDLNIPDGKSLVLLSKFGRSKISEKVSGASLFLKICEMSSKNDISIYLLGCRTHAIVEKAKERLLQDFPNLQIAGIKSPSMGFESNLKECLSLVSEINKVQPDILFVGVGSPKQEFWLRKYKDQLNIKVGIGVGASIDFAAGQVSMPPQLIKKLGLAWIWRLMSEPKRLWKRYIINDLPYFFRLLYIQISK